MSPVPSFFYGLRERGRRVRAIIYFSLVVGSLIDGPLAKG